MYSEAQNRFYLTYHGWRPPNLNSVHRFKLAWGTSNHDVIKKFEQILLCHELLDLWSDFYRKRTWFASFLCWLMCSDSVANAHVILEVGKLDKY